MFTLAYINIVETEELSASDDEDEDEGKCMCNNDNEAGTSYALDSIMIDTTNDNSKGYQ